MTEFHHVSILAQACTDWLIQDTNGVYVDGTVGGAGHAGKLAERLQPGGTLVAIDRDPDALAVAKERLQGFACNVKVVQGNHQEMDVLLDQLGIEAVDGVLLDLGVSSFQLDTAERGFSYMQDGPLDMRMNPEDDLDAAKIVNEYGEKELADIIFHYGEERWAKRIAQFIVQARTAKPITTTGELVEIIKHAIPAAARREGPHPAKRTFQALRIAVNGELDGLEQGLLKAVERLKPGGRIAVITFHSLEDRIVKKTFQMLAKKCICPPNLPICTCHHIQTLGKLAWQAPSEAEIEANPRARSAKLRMAEKKDGIPQ